MRSLFSLLLLTAFAWADTTPSMGLIKPTVPDVNYASKINVIFNQIDAHDHSVGKGVLIPTAGIADSAVTSAKIAAGAIGPTDLADLSVTTAKLADGAVTSLKIANSTIVTDDISSISGSVLVNGTVPFSKIVGPLTGTTARVALSSNAGTASWLAGVFNDEASGVKIIGGEIAQTGNAVCPITTGTGFSTTCSLAGTVAVTFTSGFTVAPYCLVSLSENVNDVSCRGTLPATTGFTTACVNAAGTGQNRSRSFVCFGKF